MIEILSPVGNSKCLTAAVRAGADAVYLGMEQFNARRNADNFSSDSLIEAVAYCHIRGVKVYLTLNTLLYQNELTPALDTAIKASEAGVDGIIIADLGLCKLIHAALPKMPIHASTQMSVHTKDALPVLKELGFCRVVPAREMSKDQLKEFCKEAKRLGLEVEVFIHGALCMAMSGQCLMSAHLGGRSGNRGLCAGTCRLPFNAGGKNEYALSLKDMSHIEYIEELNKMGVVSFKIEGRMKPPEYVAAATAACRQMADEGAVDAELLELLVKIFSRNGFTDGYYSGNKKDMFGVRTDSDLLVTRSAENKIHELYRNERQSVAIDFTFICKQDKACELTATDRKNTVKVVGKIPETAVNRPLDKTFIKNQLEKLGGTPFKAENTVIELGENLSLSVAEIKAMRRNAIEDLSKLRSKSATVARCETLNECKTPFSSRISKKPKFFARFRDINLIPENLEGIDAVIIPAETVDKYHGTTDIIAELPRGMANKELLEKEIENAKQHKLSVICHNLASLHLARENQLKIISGSGLNALNSISCEVLQDLGAEINILSYESRISDFKNFDLSSCILNVYGNTPLMLTANCPIKESVGCKNCKNKITDRMGVDFPIYCRAGYCEIYNSRPLYLADRMNEFKGFYGYILNFLDQTKEETEKIILGYINATDYKPQEYTRGLYYKGVF